MPLTLVRSPSTHTLWNAFADAFLEENDSSTGPDDFRAFAWLTHRIQRDALYQAAAARGVRAWLGPPVAFFSDLPQLFDIRERPVGLLRRQSALDDLAHRLGDGAGALSGATPRKLDTSPNASGGAGALSPDGSQVAYYEYKDAWGFIEVTPTAGGPHRRLTRRTDFVFQTSPLWSPDATRLAVSDWDFTDATTDVLEMGVLDTLRRRLTHIPHSFEEPRAYTADGRSVLFAMQSSDGRVMAVRVGDLLARASASRP